MELVWGWAVRHSSIVLCHINCYQAQHYTYSLVSLWAGSREAKLSTRDILVDGTFGISASSLNISGKGRTEGSSRLEEMLFAPTAYSSSSSTSICTRAPSPERSRCWIIIYKGWLAWLADVGRPLLLLHLTIPSIQHVDVSLYTHTK